MDGLAHSVIVSGAVASGDQNTGTHSNAVEEADHQEDQAAGGADGGQCVVAYVIADAPGVKGIVKLLEDISQENGQGEKQHCFPDRPAGQTMTICWQCAHPFPVSPL